MREIRFRLWDKENGQMYDEGNCYADWFLWIDGTIWLVDCDKNDDKNISDRFELSQYTGLKDKNGKKMFEGDIVRGRHIDGRHYNWEVKFDEGRFVMWWPPSKSALEGGFGWPFYDNLRGIEIIGNIYQNPELLENK